jgi:hypothetical protein
MCSVRMFLREFAMFLSGRRMMLGSFVFAARVMMLSLMVVMRGSVVVMRGSVVVARRGLMMLARRMFRHFSVLPLQ